MNIIDGKKIAEKILAETKNEISVLPKPPILAATLVGNDPASSLYVRIKEKRCKEIGIIFKKIHLPETTSQESIIDAIIKLNSSSNVSAIIIQLPLPKNLDTNKIINTVNANKDADALNEKSDLESPTVGAILEIIKQYNISLKNKNICLVGYGRLVGEPLAKELHKLGIDPDICTNETKNLSDHTKVADILISATGVPGLITSDMVKDNAVVIDAGTSVERVKNLKPASQSDGLKVKSTIVGDVDFENVKNKASLITPPTGGIGPITVAKLLANVVILSKRINK